MCYCTMIVMVFITVSCDTVENSEEAGAEEFVGEFSLNELIVFGQWCTLPCFGGRASNIEDYFVEGALSFNLDRYSFTMRVETRAASTGEVRLVTNGEDTGSYQKRDSTLVFNPQTSREFRGIIENDSLRVYSGFKGVFGSDEQTFDARFYKIDIP